MVVAPEAIPAIAGYLGGGVAATAAAGAVFGAGVTAAGDVVSGNPLTLGSVGKGAIAGGVTAGLGAEMGPTSSTAGAIAKGAALGATGSVVSALWT